MQIIIFKKLIVKHCVHYFSLSIPYDVRILNEIRDIKFHPMSYIVSIDITANSSGYELDSITRTHRGYRGYVGYHSRRLYVDHKDAGLIEAIPSNWT